tara:strand:- start:4127 stop:4258 length:132 start_codon:yes stop_codon:yes gene_type:complete
MVNEENMKKKVSKAKAVKKVRSNIRIVLSIFVLDEYFIIELHD